MATFGTVQVGRLFLREDRELSRSTDADSGYIEVSLTGQESCPHLTRAQTIQRAQDVLNLRDAFVPILFTDKTELNGYYIVTDVEADQSTYLDDGGVNLIPWQMKATLIGSDSEVDIESRTGGAQTRANDFTAVGERWHAPAIGALGYFVGGAVPAQLSRTGADGVMTIYRNIQFGSHPRWACPVVSYGLGRVRFLSGGVERSGCYFAPDVSNWELNNGLVQIKPQSPGGTISVNSFTGGAFQAKVWFLQVNGSTITSFDRVSVIRNDYEAVQIRLFKSLGVSGRATVDLTLNRGSRFVQVYFQSSTSSTLKIVRGTTEAGVAGTPAAWVQASVADALGNKYVVGSAKTTTVDLVNGGVSKASTVSLDAFIGVQIGSAPSGDTALDLFHQYLGLPTETTRGVTR